MRSMLLTAKASFIVTSNPPTFSSRSEGASRFSTLAWRRVFFRRASQRRSRRRQRFLCPMSPKKISPSRGRLWDGEIFFGDIGQRKRSEEHTSELQSRGHLVCRLLLEKKNDTLQ